MFETATLAEDIQRCRQASGPRRTRSHGRGDGSGLARQRSGCRQSHRAGRRRAGAPSDTLLVPALINKLTIQYRLRALFVEWVGIDLSQAGDNFASMDLFSSDPAWIHVTVLVGYTLGLILVATWLVRKREYLVTASVDVS